MKNSLKTFLILSMVFAFASCIVDGNVDSATDDTASTVTTVTATANTPDLSAVSITCAESISYNAEAKLTANATYSGSSTLVYTWEITSGGDYAAFSGSDSDSSNDTGSDSSSASGSTATLKANNTTEDEQKVTVLVTVSDGSSTVEASATVKISAKEVVVEDKLTAVSLSSESQAISASGKTKLTATPTYTGTPQITYLWEIISGGDYAYFTSGGEGSVSKTTVDDGDCKISGNNTTDSSQVVTVKVTASDGANSYSAEMTITVKAVGVYSDKLYLNLTDGTVSADGITYSEISTSNTKFSDDTLLVKYTKDEDKNSTGLVKVDATSFDGELTVNITGTTTTGGVKIQSNGTDVVNVILNDAKITSSNYPCLEVTKGSETNVILTGTNVFVDGRVYGTGYGEEYSTSSSDTYEDDDGNTVSCTVVEAAQREGSDGKGALYSKGSLTLGGSGSLSVTQSYKNCIATKATLTINGGTYELVSTGKSGLYGDTSVVINDGNITFNGTGSVSSSTFRKANGIKTDTDDSTSSVYINGGSLNVTTYNGKGINSSKVYIAGGTNTFNVTGVTGYTNDSTTRISYYDADGVYYSSQSVNFAAEGIEGASIVEITGGTTEVTSTDDGINVSDSSAAFYMKDGCLYVYSIKGDGIDCNGNLYVQGGCTVSYAPTGSEDSFDSGSKIYVTGGVIAGTSGSQMALSEYNTSGQKVLYFTGSSSSMGGGGFGGSGHSSSSSSSSSSFSKVAVYMSGTLKYAFTLPSSSFGLFVMSAPSFTSSSSSSYTVYTSPTFSGGTDFNGLYASDESSTILPTVTTGSSTKTPSIK